MRLDLFLKKVLIVKQRETAKKLCDGGYITVNGSPAKASRAVQTGDLIAVETISGLRSYRVAAIPEGSVRRDEASRFYETVG